METEKVCVNLSAAEVGKLDVLVAQGAFVSRTDVIRAALRTELAQHAEAIERYVHTRIAGDVPAPPKVVTGMVGLGYYGITSQHLEETAARGERIQVRCAGIVSIDDDVSPELADRTIHQLHVLGSVRGPKAVLDRLRDRIDKRVF